VRIAAVLSPVADPALVIEAARAADDAGLDAVGLWDHYHSARPDWAYVAGWSALGAIGAVTSRVGIVPLVLNHLHHELGVLAKETSVLSLATGGRFELGIGAGDWPESFAAWGRPYPGPDERVSRLVATVDALRRLWAGEAVTWSGRGISLDGAISTPAPIRPPRVVVGIGGSRGMLERVVRIADELNVYGDGPLEAAREAIAASGRAITLSASLSWKWEKWPVDPSAELAAFEERGVERVFISIGSNDMPVRIASLAAR
jgi:alkanesulfonate monooxygenase SsuD/methylene tetrahydromethanopterin reductase-like flavin-dependent oxidoreductase (luciferase family)